MRQSLNESRGELGYISQRNTRIWATDGHVRIMMYHILPWIIFRVYQCINHIYLQVMVEFLVLLRTRILVEWCHRDHLNVMLVDL